MAAKRNICRRCGIGFFVPENSIRDACLNVIACQARIRRNCKSAPRRIVLDAIPIVSNLYGQKWRLSLACGHEIEWGLESIWRKPQDARCYKCQEIAKKLTAFD